MKCTVGNPSARALDYLAGPYDKQIILRKLLEITKYHKAVCRAVLCGFLRPALFSHHLVH